MDYGSLAGIVVILVFVAFIFSKKGKGTVDYLLIVFNLLLAGFMALNSINLHNLSSASLVAQNTIPFFIFPAFAFMVLQTTTEGPIDKKWYGLLVPGIAFFALTLWHHSTRDYSQEDLLVEYNTPPLIYHVFFKGYQIVMLMVLIVLQRRMAVYQQNIENRFSYVDPIEVSWLRIFGWIYFASILLTMIIFLTSNFNLLPIDINTAFITVNGMLILAVFYMNFQGIKHYTIAQFYQSNAVALNASVKHDEAMEPSEKEERAGRLEEERAERVFAAIQEAVRAKELYLEPTLRLRELSDEIGESTHTISEAINRVGNQSFFDFINGYRVDHLKRLLSEPGKKQFTILALGLESGFNSKASLNRIFKSATGLTPLQYQKENR